MAIASGISVAPAVGKEAIAQPPAAQAGDRRQRRLGGLQAREDALGVPDERLAGGGQADAARMALEQRHAGFGLERGDLLGDRRLRVGERLGGGRERAAVGDLLQDPQAADVEHKYNLYQDHENHWC